MLVLGITLRSWGLASSGIICDQCILRHQYSLGGDSCHSWLCLVCQFPLFSSQIINTSRVLHGNWHCLKRIILAACERSWNSLFPWRGHVIRVMLGTRLRAPALWNISETRSIALQPQRGELLCWAPFALQRGWCSLHRLWASKLPPVLAFCGLCPLAPCIWLWSSS